MKKIYLLAASALFAFTANAQFDDDIESYPVGPIENAVWQSWDAMGGTGDDISVTEDQAASGSKSIVVAEGGVIDGVLNLDNKTSGTWYLTWNMYIPAGKTGYFNIQNTLPAGTQWNFHCNFNEGGENPGGFDLADATGANQGPGTIVGSGTYPEGEWFEVKLVVDLDAATMDVKVAGNDIVSGTNYTGDSLGGINFYSIDANNLYYLDDARLDETELGTSDFSGDVFSVYPNPVVDVLNIKSASVIDNVTIYDVLGKQVLSVNPDAISPSVDMSNLSSGAYLVNVTIGNASKTIKVLK